MQTWTWQISNGSTYLTCSLLDRWPHGFFTRQFWPQVPQELAPVLRPEAKVFRVKQVHGNQILNPTEVILHFDQQQTLNPDTEITFPNADGLISDGPIQAIWVCSADCTPVLIADERTGHVSAVHAGWRGTAAKIVPEAIARLQAQGSRIEDLRVAMGPAISGEVYQVTTEVAVQVGQSILEVSSVRGLMELPNSPILADEKEGHVRLDVRQINAIQLERMGLEAEQIAIAPHCTFQDPERFFSYRRDGLKQVQWSGIVSTPA